LDDEVVEEIDPGVDMAAETELLYVVARGVVAATAMGGGDDKVAMVT
jgi:hypothetical protein